MHIKPKWLNDVDKYMLWFKLDEYYPGINKVLKNVEMHRDDKLTSACERMKRLANEIAYS